MKKLSYQHFVHDLASGSHYGVFIDDTGSPGLQSAPPTLHPERKSWAGVIVPPNQMPEVLIQLPGAIDELQRLTGGKEFHFADIYHGKGDFKEVDLQARLGIFRAMAEIFRVYQFPIFVQTFDPHSLREIHSQAPSWLPNRVDPFNLRRHEDVALLFLLIRIKWYVEKTREQHRLARVFVDEGYKRNGIAICIDAWKPVFADGLICFASSSLVQPIQLADFAAFVLNREQILLGKEVLSSLDREWLEIVSPMLDNYQNIEKRAFQLEELDDVLETSA